MVREVTKNPMVALTERLSLTVMVVLLECSPISAALHQSGLYGRVARRKRLLSKRHLKTQTMRNKILWSKETKIEHFGLNAKRHV